MARFGRSYPISRILVPPPYSLITEYDNSAQSAYQNTLASGGAVTHAHTAALDCYALVAVYGDGSAGLMNRTATAAVTFGGQALTELGGAYANNNSALDWVRVFGGNHVPSGGQTVSVTLTQAGGVAFKGRTASFTYTNVAAANLVSNTTGLGTSPSDTAATTIGNMVWGTVFAATTAGPSNFSLTTRQSQSGTGNLPAFVAGDTKADATSETISASVVSSSWGLIGVDLIAIDNA